MPQLPTIKVDQKVEYEKKKDRERKCAVEKDIGRINIALEAGDKEQITSLHIEMDNKYQSCISGWPLSMYGYFEGYGFKYEYIGLDDLIHNLHSMKAKLEAFSNGWNCVQPKNSPRAYTPSQDVTVTVNNNVNIDVSFDMVRSEIEDISTLTQAQTDEIIDKINELEEISKENISRKSKWEKVKPIISFALDKGVDIAMKILGLIVQMKLGQ